MKKIIRYSFLVILVLQMSGCTLEDIIERGDKCPPVGSDAVLSYIETPDCTKDACENASYQENFTDNVCPLAFPKCVADDETLSSYHCAKDTLLVCDDGILCGTPEECIKPSDSRWCGASSCSEENYGGKKCDEDNGFHCVKSDEEWTCLRINAGTIDCDGEKIYSSNDKTCGASSCDKENNYGGVDCTLKPNEFCKNAGNGFECTCKSGTIHCGEDCIQPRVDKAHCGAAGSCSDDDPASVNFKGVECGENQVCDCTGDSCGCIQNPCDAESMLYCYVNDAYACIGITDEHHCGQCDIDCAVMKPENADFAECALNGSEYSCKFACSDGFANCSGDDSTLKCVDLKTDNDYCGDCTTRCGSKESCIDGVCRENVCNGETQCIDENGVCHSDEAAYCGQNGQRCSSCTSSDKARCVMGKCEYDECNIGTHPIYNEGKIVNCEPNTRESCAPTVGVFPLVNCSEMEHIKSSKCNDDGVCEATECEDNYHSYNLQCELNSIENCGSHENNCMSNGVAEATCENGACVVKACHPGFHLFENKCEADDPNNCGMHGNNCIKDVITAANCVNATCQITACGPGFHVYNNSCEADGTSSCGSHDNNCITGTVTAADCVNGACVVKACKGGYHFYNNSCEADDTANCGSHGNNCITGNIASANCVNGACQVTGCNGNYHVYNNSCKPDDKNNCGAHGKSCMGANIADAVCENKTCRVTQCEQNYHISSERTACEPNYDNSCAPTNMTLDDYKQQTGHYNCQDGGAASVCRNGECACPNPNEVPDTFNFKCGLPRGCMGITGVSLDYATRFPYYAQYDTQTSCFISTCIEGYFIENGDYPNGECRPIRDSIAKVNRTCESFGYKYSEGKFCTAKGEDDCLNGYRWNGGYVCLLEDAYCGGIPGSLSNSPKNCLAQGKTCVNGKCQ